jgi:hypothetical protein
MTTDDRDHFLVHIRVEHVTHTTSQPEPATRSQPSGRRGTTRRIAVELFSTTMRGQSHPDILMKAEKLIALERDMPSDPRLVGHVDDEDEEDD